MALPVVKTLVDCTDFTQTVTPFIPQLRNLPFLVYESIASPQALKQIYIDTNPLISAFAFSLFLFPVFLLISEVNRNYSQVDRCWSILPSVYNVHYVIYAHLTGRETTRLDTLGAASIIWTLRLTFNYWRKGGYSIGSEDYRWEVLRKYISPPLFFIFNVTFISLAQSILLFSITTPTYILLLTSRLSTPMLSTAQPNQEPSWTTADIVFSRAIMACVMISFFADQQQWNYQQAKKKYQETAKLPPNSKYDQDDLDRGFIISGLWSWSRHPNFAAEQGVWVFLYQWSCWNTDTLYNWTGLGALAYLVLFQASTWFTELLSARKYPEYKDYQRLVGKFLPKRFKGLDEIETNSASEAGASIPNGRPKKNDANGETTDGGKI